MLNPAQVIQGIYTVSQLIYEHVKEVKANPRQCQRLARRVLIVESAIRDLDKMKDKKQYEEGLNHLLEMLKRLEAFIKEFTASSKWYRYVLKAGTYKTKFEEFSQGLQNCLQDLNLGLVAKQVVDRVHDKADEEADRTFLILNQKEIIRLNEEANRQLQRQEMQQAERHDIILKQLASIQEKITAFNVPGGISKLPLESQYMISFFELTFDKKIAEGSCGKIYLGRWNEDNVVIKNIEPLNDGEMTEFIREVQIMSGLRSKQITQFYGACFEAGRACLVMEHMEQGSLDKRVGTLTPEQQKKMALDIVYGLRYLHSQGILHRDLKPSAILVNSHWEAKLSGFGLSKTKRFGVQTSPRQSQSFEWQAPECLQRGTTYTKASDIYSYGLVLWSILSGKMPYETIPKDKMAAHIIMGNKESIVDTIPSEYADIIRRCWDSEPKNRPALEEIIPVLERQLRPRSSSLSGEDYYKQGISQEEKLDYENAKLSYDKSFKKGYFKAETNLGLFFLRGIGGAPQDKKQAYQHFLSAAEKGHPRAMFNVAMMLERGDGISSDLPLALYWYESAAKNGDVKASGKAERLRAVLAPQSTYQDFNASFR